jgi:hypothetical protein
MKVIKIQSSVYNFLTRVIFLLYLYTFILNFTNCLTKSSLRRDKLKREDKIRYGQLITKLQVGKMNLLPDGPMTDEELHDFLIREREKTQGNPDKVGVVYIDKRIAELPVGQTRIKPKGIVLFFPDDEEAIKNYQNPEDNDNIKRTERNDRLMLERKILNEATNHPEYNPYKDIYDEENKFLNYESDVKKDVHKKNLLNLAIEKEEEIFKSELKKEHDEYFEKKFNKAFIDNVYKFRNHWAKEQNVKKEEVSPADDFELDAESKEILETYKLKKQKKI